uniref:Uncharacterized protein n=1 Tax=Lepeophtheirus salmonis TaxID=72036 RepID=A0A0K2U2S2_LEPSM
MGRLRVLRQTCKSANKHSRTIIYIIVDTGAILE